VNVLISFYSHTGNTKKIAERLKACLEAKSFSVTLHEIKPKGNASPKEISKMGSVLLEKPVPDISGFDLVFVGTPVWGMMPCPVVVSFLKALPMFRAKKFVLFASCHAFTGSAIKKMSGLLSIKGARVIDSFSVKSLFALNEKNLKKADVFCEKLVSALS